MKNKFLFGAILSIFAFSLATCEKQTEKIDNNNTTLENDISQARDGDYTIGYYHNEILDAIITEYREITADNAEDIYNDIKALTVSYFPDYEPFSYDDFESYRVKYIPNTYLTMEGALATGGAGLFTDLASNLLHDRLITANEQSYYEDFEKDFFATTNYDGANGVIESYIAKINSDVSLTRSETVRLQQAFDIGKYSLSYWDAQAELGVRSPWGVIARLSDERRPRWLTVLLKVGSDICGGAVGAGVGFALGGPAGAIGGGLLGGGAASALMWN